MSTKRPSITPVQYKIQRDKRDLVRRAAAQAQADGATRDDVNQSAIIDYLITPEAVADAVAALKRKAKERTE